MTYDTKGIDVFDAEGRRIMAGRFITDDTLAEACALDVGDTDNSRALTFGGVYNSPDLPLCVNGVSDFLDRNGVRDVWDSMDYRQHGLVYAAFAFALEFSEGLVPKLPSMDVDKSHTCACEGTYSAEGGLGKTHWIVDSARFKSSSIDTPSSRATAAKQVAAAQGSGNDAARSIHH